jgi:hypothetical protein
MLDTTCMDSGEHELINHNGLTWVLVLEIVVFAPGLDRPRTEASEVL